MKFWEAIREAMENGKYIKSIDDDRGPYFFRKDRNGIGPTGFCTSKDNCNAPLWSDVDEEWEVVENLELNNQVKIK